MIEVLYNNNRFEVYGDTYHKRHIFKDNHFRWDPKEKCWYTPYRKCMFDALNVINTAEDIFNGCNKAVVQELTKKEEASKERYEQSFAEDSDFSVPAPEGLNYYPYQLAAIRYMVEGENILLADEMGLGKTPMVIGLLNLDEDFKRVLVVCPNRLKDNFKRELERWLVKPVKITILNPKNIKKYESSDEREVVIVNYESIFDRNDKTADGKKRKHVRPRTNLDLNWDYVFYDEAHRLKNSKAKRTKAALKLKANKFVAMTGTPVPNRPAELYPILNKLDPNRWRNWEYYIQRYCNAFDNGWGWDYSGSSNTRELQSVLRSTIMVARKKEDVLTELPDKVYQLIEFEDVDNVAANEQSAIDEHRPAINEFITSVRNNARLESKSDMLGSSIAEIEIPDFTSLEKVRHETAIKKLPFVKEHIEDCLESINKIVVFGHHRDVLEEMHSWYPDESVLIYGGVSNEEASASVDRFMTDDTCKIFFGGITVVGEGLTLTAASHAIFVEVDWVPSTLKQAEDRLHRVGQKDCVNIQYLVFPNTIDELILRVVLQKEKVSKEVVGF